MTSDTYVLYTYQFVSGQVACHVYGPTDQESAKAKGAKLQAAFQKPVNDPTAVFSYVVAELGGESDGQWVLYTSIAGFGPATVAATRYTDELAAYKAALAFEQANGISAPIVMVLPLEAVPA